MLDERIGCLLHGLPGRCDGIEHAEKTVNESVVTDHLYRASRVLQSLRIGFALIA